MKKIDKKIDDVINYIKNINGNSSDIFSRTIDLSNKKIAYLFLESVSSDDKISNFLLDSISWDIKLNKTNFFTNVFKQLENTLPNSKIKIIDNYDDMFYYLSSGFTCVVIDGYNKCIAVETKAKLDRGVVEATTEKIIRGPKDAFTENPLINIGLIRKRIKDPNLWFTDVIIGRRTKTKVTVSYIKDIADSKFVKKIIDKLKQIDIDGILDSGYIRDFLEPNQSSSFPKMISTERPDMACGSMLEGKIVILVENTPFVLIAPGLLIDFFHSPEDYYQKSSNVTFSRILRIICFIVTFIVPSLYIALMTFNHEILPDRLLISLATQRDGVPFPSAIEVILFGITFELLRESDLRSPSASGTAMSIVGALILGDAAVNAGIVSPIVIIVTAITSISELIFPDVDMINATRSWRLIFILSAVLMGLIGLTLAIIVFITKLASMESLGIPYLTPLSPINITAWQDTIFKKSRNKLKVRPSYLAKNNLTRLGSDNNEN